MFVASSPTRRDNIQTSSLYWPGGHTHTHTEVTFSVLCVWKLELLLFSSAQEPLCWGLCFLKRLPVSKMIYFLLLFQTSAPPSFISELSTCMGVFVHTLSFLSFLDLYISFGVTGKVMMLIPAAYGPGQDTTLIAWPFVSIFGAWYLAQEDLGISLKVSWHLPLLLGHLPCFVRLIAWKEKPFISESLQT